MPVVAVFQSPSFTRDQYEESVLRLTGGKGRVESPADWPVEGLLAHLREIGVEGEPEIYAAHTFVSA